MHEGIIKPEAAVKAASLPLAFFLFSERNERKGCRGNFKQTVRGKNNALRNF
jgi:hypothetical protein